MSPSQTRSGRLDRDAYDVVVVGGGHNGLVAAAYLARAGVSVAVLERLPHTGGAAVSAEAFAGHPVRLSRYSYLVSLLPQSIVTDLGLDVRLTSRTTASYTPYRREGQDRGLLVERPEGEATAASFAALGPRGGDEYAAWTAFYDEVTALAEVVAPTLTQPLPRVEEVAAQVAHRASSQIWDDVVTNPLGAAIERRFADDLVRGVVGTDALIGTFAALDDPSLIQNRCFLYHLIGNGTGEWKVPVGGMGAVTDALRAAAQRAGAQILTSAEVTRIDAETVTFRDPEGTHAVGAGTVLAGVAPWVLADLVGDELTASAKPQGSQLKINFLLDRLPELRSGADPAVAFAGTLHLAESARELEAAYADAAAGRVPAVLPGEVYCHSLTDPSILGSLAGTGAQTLTYFGLHTPAALFDGETGDTARRVALDRAIASLDDVLVEPLMSVVARDAAGEPCIEVKVPQDVEKDLAMPGGHIFHGDLEWPWAPARAALDTPAQAWGVDTAYDGILLCGSGTRRGGAVSGLGGHNAAQAVLAAR